MLSSQHEIAAAQQIYELRYIAYLGNHSIEPNEDRVFTDKYDVAPNCVSHIEYIDGEPAGSIRVCVYHPSAPNLPVPAAENFSSELRARLGENKILVEASKFVINPGFQFHKRQLKFALMKYVFDYAISINADYIIGEPRPSHVNFYRHFLFEPISAVKPAKHVSFDTVLLACPLKKSRQRVRSEPKYENTLKRIGLF